ncbi:phosphoribosyltransferase [Candidatus Uhrbacteria bacterium]|nr:phosphoribosyltransferase [Candidatus Uhrbacteria bacterium]
MQSLHSAPSHGDYYVVTHDVAQRLQSFRSATLDVPRQNDPMFDDFHAGLQEKMQQALVGVSVHTVHIDDLARTIWEKVKHRVGDRLVVSTCSEIISVLNRGSRTLNINRLFDSRGELVGHGPRPGCESLARQLDDLASAAGNRSVFLIEEGAYSGGTIRFVLRQLHERGVEVSTLVMGFCTPKTRDYIKEVFDGEIIVINEIGELVDWITDHDLIPFTPGCGRVMEEKTPEGCVCAFPYILPFGRMEEWTSLPEDIARGISRFCLEASIRFFDGFSKSDGSALTIRDLVDSYPAVPIPVGNGEIPSLDAEVVGFLRAVRGRLV